MDTWLTQSTDLRLLWGASGAAALAGEGVAVVVDVLSFTTTLSVALDRGIEVVPVPDRAAGARVVARERDAVLAQPRRTAADPGGPGTAPAGMSLSPASVRASAHVARLVLPSPNGATVAHLLRRAGQPVLGACLRNADAVAGWVRTEHPGLPVTVVAAGERWPDGTLRPAVEDLWGAGAVLAALAGEGRTISPEARAAVAAYREAAQDLPTVLRASTSGRELAARGHGDDVLIAAEVGASDVVPVLRAQVFVRG